MPELQELALVQGERQPVEQELLAAAEPVHVRSAALVRSQARVRRHA